MSVERGPKTRLTDSLPYPLVNEVHQLSAAFFIAYSRLAPSMYLQAPGTLVTLSGLFAVFCAHQPERVESFTKQFVGYYQIIDTNKQILADFVDRQTGYRKIKNQIVERKSAVATKTHTLYQNNKTRSVIMGATFANQIHLPLFNLKRSFF